MHWLPLRLSQPPSTVQSCDEVLDIAGHRRTPADTAGQRRTASDSGADGSPAVWVSCPPPLLLLTPLGDSSALMYRPVGRPPGPATPSRIIWCLSAAAAEGGLPTLPGRRLSRTSVWPNPYSATAAAARRRQSSAQRASNRPTKLPTAPPTRTPPRTSPDQPGAGLSAAATRQPRVANEFEGPFVGTQRRAGLNEAG